MSITNSNVVERLPYLSILFSERKAFHLQRIEKPNGLSSVGFFYPLEFDFSSYLAAARLYRAKPEIVRCHSGNPGEKRTNNFFAKGNVKLHLGAFASSRE